MLTDQQWMRKALEIADRAAARGEVPVGAILARGDSMLGVGGNARRWQSSPLEHAEILALTRAARRTGDWRFPGSCMYVTLEPCPMCTGALLQARVPRLVFGAYNRESGCSSSLLNLGDLPGSPYQMDVQGGILETECAEKLKSFFRSRRGG